MTGPLPEATGAPLVDFVALMARMRAECAWKAEQTHTSLARFLLEETHEALEAIDSGDPAHLREELGDLLLQVYFHAEIARQAGEFTIDDVAADLAAKMIRRNPHVFGDGSEAPTDPAPTDPAEVEAIWQAAKAAEKRRTSVLDGIPPTLPALLLADKVLGRSEREGTPVVTPALGEGEPVDSSEIGDQLLAVVARARTVGVDPEQALRDAVRRLL